MRKLAATALRSLAPDRLRYALSTLDSSRSAAAERGSESDDHLRLHITTLLDSAE